MANKNKLKVYLPIIVAGAIVVGIVIGLALSDNLPNNTLVPTGKNSTNKFVELVNYAEEQYVDTIDANELVEESIQHFLQELDPHSYYLSKDKLAQANESLDGNFEGVGVEFRIQDDTLIVANPIPGGPSERAGILAGDRILIVDGENISGPELTNKKVTKILKGPGGTDVHVAVKRRGAKQLLEFDITRGSIPIHSLDAAFRLNDETGYIKISTFGRRTYNEMLEGLEKINARQLKNLILDLRNNGGGYLNIAVDMADEFLKQDQMIVYTEGKNQSRVDYKSSRQGKLDDVNLVVLVNENSASASEIVAGAIQDNDRGTIIGRRSFGKGLVQEPLHYKDGTMVRLTVARYYTPTGRCIQKPYGEGIDYDGDAEKRYEKGELFSQDSILFDDSLKFVTPGGKTVYGGGGIMPDIFVPIDTSYTSDFFYDVAYGGLIDQYAFNYVDKNRKALKSKYNSVDDFTDQFTTSDIDFDDFLSFAAAKEVDAPSAEDLDLSKGELLSRIRANIARSMWQNEGYFKSTVGEDPVIKEALQHFGNGNIAIQ